jgi:Protein of unknown function (DUF1553)/Protein of unknown function (DUF1549)/Planctomycete cytochrome C/Concanavalin A-like lectin/glucanases superfamily
MRVAATTVVCLALATVAVAQAPDFDRTVAPLLIERCIDCHSGAKPKGKLDLTRKSTAARTIVAGEAKLATLWQRVAADEMPPKKPLSEKERAILKAWIDSGAAWGTDPIDSFRVSTSKRAGYDWWSLQPVRRPSVPNVKAKTWPANPIDHFILAKLEAEGLTPSPPAEPGPLLRRLHFDLIGLPPTPSEIVVFVDEAKTNPQKAFAKRVDYLLASDRYGERWARHWLDIVRFGESNGFEHDELRKNAWPYRDWVISALNADVPYNEFALQQIAGDVLKPTDPSAITATGFLVAGGYDSVGQGQQSAAMKAVVRQDELEDIVGGIGQTFLGLTVQCARCHDHKFDPVRSEEYYRMSAAVAGVRHGERDIMSTAARQALEKRRRDADLEIEKLRSELVALEAPIRATVLAERKKTGASPKTDLPKALARWDFTKSGKDEVGGIEVSLRNGAQLKADGLRLAGDAYAMTGRLPHRIQAKTLTATVRLANQSQRGGALLSLQSLDGSRFDAIVFGEREAGKWMAGSEFFRRTKDLGGPRETDIDEPVHLAIVYLSDGTITAYRNGLALGKPYKADNTLTLEPNEWNLLFGLRHSPAGGNKHLVGTIVRAELYNRALTAQELAVSAGAATDFVSDNEIVARLDAASKAQRAGMVQKISEAKARRDAPPPSQRAYAVTPRSPEPTFFLERGNPVQKGALLAPGGVPAVGLKADFGLDSDAPDANRRIKLAEWITNVKNPLFARVMVNRLWHYHFGVGLVDTPSDFGFNGGRCSHRELLDWLADEFVRSGYSQKHIHRLIVNSSTYRQSSRYRADAAKVDASNRWLWRHSPQRLEAEALRDSILAASGQLRLGTGGPGYQDFKLTIRGATHYYDPIDTDDPALYRRSIYRTWARSGRNRFLDAHDCPDPSTATPRRAVTITPLQALSMMNNAFVLRMADRFAERIKREAGADIDAQVGRAIELAYCRSATKAEIDRIRPMVEQHGLEALCRALFNSNEFAYVD